MIIFYFNLELYWSWLIFYRWLLICFGLEIRCRLTTFIFAYFKSSLISGWSVSLHFICRLMLFTAMNAWGIHAPMTTSDTPLDIYTKGVTKNISTSDLNPRARLKITFENAESANSIMQRIVISPSFAVVKAKCTASCLKHLQSNVCAPKWTNNYLRKGLPKFYMFGSRIPLTTWSLFCCNTVYWTIRLFLVCVT